MIIKLTDMSSSEHGFKSFVESVKHYASEFGHVLIIILIVLSSLVLTWAFLYSLLWCFGMLPRQRSRLRLSSVEEEESASLLSRMERGVAGSEHLLQTESGWVEDQRALVVRPCLPPKTSKAYRKIQSRLASIRRKRSMATFWKYTKRGVRFIGWCFRWCWYHCAVWCQRSFTEKNKATDEELEPLLREPVDDGLVECSDESSLNEAAVGLVSGVRQTESRCITFGSVKVVLEVTEGKTTLVENASKNVAVRAEEIQSADAYPNRDSSPCPQLLIADSKESGLGEPAIGSPPTNHLKLTVDELVSEDDCDTPFKKARLAEQKKKFSEGHVTGAFERMCVAELKYRHGILPYTQATDMMFRREFRELFEKRNMRLSDRHDAMNRCMAAIWLPSDGEIDYLKLINSMYFKERRRWADDSVRNTDSWWTRFQWWVSGAGRGSGISNR